jgi:type VI secretion system secreted protein VgrG
MSEQRLEFVTLSQMVEPGLIQLRWLRGREALSEPYEYELELEVDEDGGLGLDALEDVLRMPCGVRFGRDGRTEVHGVLGSIRMLSTSQPQPIVYRATLVPKLRLLASIRRSRIFQDLDPAGIVRAVLEEHGLREGEHFELRLTGTHPTWEYKVQYQESDLDFLNRVLEHHGIFYFFAQDPDGERVVFADDNHAFARCEGAETLEYTPGEAAQLRGVRELTRELTPQPGAVLLRDYNWRTPSVPLQSEARADPRTGRGLANLYGEHFKTPSEGDALARCRAEEIMVGRDVYRGRCRVGPLRPGDRTELVGHPCAELDQEYLVVEIEHEADGRGVQDSGGLGYDKRFTAIPYEVPFRPARRTPKPRIQGVMHARVDGEAPGTAAPIDGYGRYKIVFPFDLVGQPGGKASRWVRLAQPASGPGFGIHFPLHIGVEVAVAHLDGDPDRPIIMSSPPTAETITPVSQGNATQSQIVTQTGIRLVWDDDVRSS